MSGIEIYLDINKTNTTKEDTSMVLQKAMAYHGGLFVLISFLFAVWFSF